MTRPVPAARSGTSAAPVRPRAARKPLGAGRRLPVASAAVLAAALAVAPLWTGPAAAQQDAAQDSAAAASGDAPSAASTATRAEDQGAATAPAAAPSAAPQAAAEAEAPSGPPPVRVISLGGLTGAAAGAAADLIAARELAALHVNRGGGLPGGRRLALELVDVGCAGPEAANAGEVAAAAFREARAAAFLGPVCSDAALSAAASAKLLGAPMISDAATTPALSTLQDDDLVFRTAPSDFATSTEMAELALRRGYGSVAVSHGEDAWSTGVARAFVAAFEAQGGRIAAIQSFAPDQAEYRAEMEALAALGPGDALALFAYAGGDGEAALASALRIGAWPAVLGGDGLLDEGVIRRLGLMRLARVSLVAPWADRSAEAWRRYAAAAADAGLDPEAPLAAQGYDATMVLALALARSGGETGRALADAIREVTRPGAPPVLPDEWKRGAALAAQGPVNYIGASGPMVFDAAGDAQVPVAVWKAHAGGWKAAPLR